MSFITTDDMRQVIAATFRKNALVPQWDLLIANAVDAAYQDILAALVPRGYSKAQVDAWDGGVSLQTYLALFFLLKNQRVLEASGFSAQDVAAFDRREQLKTIVVLASGVLVDPAGPQGQPATGTITGESDDELHRRQYDARPSWEYDRHPSCDPYGDCC